MNKCSDDNNMYRLFEAYGIELEYMIVDKDTLDVRPIADTILKDWTGQVVSEVIRGPVTWSNELVNHVIEFKCTTPVNELTGLADAFHDSIRAASVLLETEGGLLMPGSMHPWMNPARETVLWSHENNEIYNTYNRIFDCNRHGWANLQSMHINLSFCGDSEFRKLHQAIRLLLPLIPAIASSSPVMDGRKSDQLDGRLNVYRQNQIRIPEIAGKIIPEDVDGYEEYDKKIYTPIRQVIRSRDPEGILEDIWLNSRGAIARFDRGSIEIRLIDIQENPFQDLSIAYGIIEVLKYIVSFHSCDSIQPDSESLLNLLVRVEEKGRATIVDDVNYLRMLGIQEQSIRTGDIWMSLIEHTRDAGGFTTNPDLLQGLLRILDEGSLSERILGALNGDFSHVSLHRVYGGLINSLVEGTMFRT